MPEAAKVQQLNGAARTRGSRPAYGRNVPVLVVSPHGGDQRDGHGAVERDGSRPTGRRGPSSAATIPRFLPLSGTNGMRMGAYVLRLTF